MTLDRLTELARLAMLGTPHADVPGTLATLQFMGREEREAAARCYASIIGERQLPAHIGIKHAQKPIAKPLAGRARVNRAAQARRILEERRDVA